MIEAIRVVMKNSRQKLTGSLKKKMPINTVPTAPIPVQTVYAVPIGSVCVAFTSSVMLMVRQTRNMAYQKSAALPESVFAFARQEANATSNKPAMIRMIQFMEAR